MDIGEWLRGLDLGQYESAFRANEINADLLKSLTADDLRDLGVALVGHRRKLLDAIAVLRADTQPVSPAGAQQTSQQATGAERRHLTVMFCDLVGSTALSTALDPEDLRDIIGRYNRCLAQAVARFDGFVAKYTGDGVLAYFGYPQAHEDDPERAIRSGLAVVHAVGELEAPERLQARVGIATGLVVVGDLIGAGEAQERGVVGETPNLAARLQAIAEPDAVVVADVTRAQIGALFEVQDLGLQGLKGFAEPQRAWRILGESGLHSRFEALRSRDTPLFGREEELAALRRLWAEAEAGEGRVAMLFGEPGIGKSRLSAEFAERLNAEPHFYLQYFCSPHHQDSALFPVITQIERNAGFASDDPLETKLEKLEALLAAPTSPEDEADLGALCRPFVIAGVAALLASNSAPAPKKAKDIRGAAAPVGNSRAAAAAADGIRGSALDRPDLA